MSVVIMQHLYQRGRERERGGTDSGRTTDPPPPPTLPRSLGGSITNHGVTPSHEFWTGHLQCAYSRYGHCREVPATQQQLAIEHVMNSYRITDRVGAVTKSWLSVISVQLLRS